MASKIRVKIKLVSSAKTGYYYTTTINKRNRLQKQQQGKFRMKKFDPVIRRHVEFVEDKVK